MSKPLGCIGLPILVAHGCTKGALIVIMSYTQERMKDDSNVAIGVNYGVASSSTWFKFVCNLVNKGPSTIIASFEGEHLDRAQTNWLALILLKGKPLGSHMVD